MSRRRYINTAAPVSLTATITTGTTNVAVSSSAGFPTPPFTIGFERGTANEEVGLVTAIPDGTHFTVTRGYDGTTAKAHNSGTSVEHCVVAMDYDEANDHVNNAGLHASAPTGTILPFVGSEAAIPAGWLLCGGQAVSRTTYSALYNIIKDAEGVDSHPFGAGNGTTTFNIPDLRGRTLIGVDNMGGSSANRVTASAADGNGGVGGTETVTLTSGEMPTHTHIQNAHTHVQNPHTHPPGAGEFFLVYYDPGGSNQHNNGVGDDFVTGWSSSGPATATNQNTTATNQNTGGGAAHANMQPWMSIRFIIKT